MNSYTYPAPFAGITEETDHLLRQVTPAAGAIWRELRRNTLPGGTIEINLKDLAEKLDYSSRWVRTALGELIEVGLVELLRRAWNYWFRLQVHDPGIVQKTSHDREKTSTDYSKTSSKQPSNPYSLVVQDPKILKSTKTVPPTHPVKENEQELIDPIHQQTSNQPPYQTAITANPTAETALRVIREAGINLNTTIQQMVIATIAQLGSAALERIHNAAAVAAAAPPTQKKTGKPTSRAALFVQALKKGWKPRDKGDTPVINEPESLPTSEPSGSSKSCKLTDECKRWRDLAYIKGVISASWINENTGKLEVLTSNGSQDWEEIKVFWTFKQLESMPSVRSIELPKGSHEQRRDESDC